tara:strand:+ start:111 stop:404 length:294 start_codon:yes stop_codon:yes gene_type:complete
MISNISFGDDTTVLDDVTPVQSTFESDYTNEPEVTIIKDGESTTEEYRINGQLYMVKVTPDGAPPYYLYKETEGSGWLRVEGISEPLIVPQWVVFEF